MSEQQRTYRPGDVANGHQLQDDGRWIPLPAMPVVPVLPTDSYWQRYRRRWPKTAPIVGFLALFLILPDIAYHFRIDPSTTLASTAGTMAIGAVLWGSLVNLLVALKK